MRITCLYGWISLINMGWHAQITVSNNVWCADDMDKWMTQIVFDVDTLNVDICYFNVC